MTHDYSRQNLPVIKDRECGLQIGDRGNDLRIVSSSSPITTMPLNNTFGAMLIGMVCSAT